MKTPGHIGGENFERGFLLLIPQEPLPQFLWLLFIIFISSMDFFILYND